VLDEKMGEEVKITVIATGFRDQMPERRARMLSVEAVPVVSVPLVSVPVEAPGNWLSEEAPERKPVQEPLPGPARFKSEDEDEEAETGESDAAFFFSSSRPAVATTVTVAASSMASVETDRGFEETEAETAALARQHPDGLAGESASIPQPRDYAADFSEGVSVAAGREEQKTEPVTSSFPEEQELHRDLDVPAFLRRLQF
jgi:cell division protein FtsZ